MEEARPPRVLLDILPGAEEEFDESFLTRNGLTVTACAGPGAGPCPLIEGHGCRLFEEAQGIVFELDFENPEHRTIVERYRELAPPDTPIRVVVTPEQAERYRDELRDFEVWTHEPTAADLDGFAARVEATQRTPR